jgi:glycine cleavage system H protein
MKAPVDRKYSETHEWFLLEDNVVTMGITQYAADELTDITYVDLPDVGAKVTAGDAVGEVESVKATSEIFSAVTGAVVAVNTTLGDHPELVNDDAFDEGWMLKIRTDTPDPLRALMGAKEYALFVRNLG